jgi:hypothetical protein
MLVLFVRNSSQKQDVMGRQVGEEGMPCVA